MQAVLTDPKFHKALNRYKSHYLNKQLNDLDESSTRIIVNHLLSDVLGYRELIDIKTEYPVQGGYIDYLIELNHRKLLVIEVKSVSTKLANKHLRQAFYYAAMVGSELIILTNARYLDLYKISFTRPLRIKKLFSVDFKKLDRKSQNLISFLTKKNMIAGNTKLLK